MLRAVPPCGRGLLPRGGPGAVRLFGTALLLLLGIVLVRLALVRFATAAGGTFLGLSEGGHGNGRNVRVLGGAGDSEMSGLLAVWVRNGFVCGFACHFLLGNAPNGRGYCIWYRPELLKRYIQARLRGVLESYLKGRRRW